jgi:cytidylate kinase
MRKKADDLGITFDQLINQAEVDPEGVIDRECDEYLFQQVWRHEKVFIEARLSHCFDPGALHVYLKCPLSIRGARRAEELRLNTGKVMTELLRRDERDMARLGRLYPNSKWDESDFDLVIDTSEVGKEEVVKKIFEAYDIWTNKRQLNLDLQMVG